jgi:hypothetical protein
MFQKAYDIVIATEAADRNARELFNFKNRVYAQKKGEGLAETGNATGSLAIIVSVVQDDSQLGLLANASIMYITYGSGSLTAHCCSLISKVLPVPWQS